MMQVEAYTMQHREFHVGIKYYSFDCIDFKPSASYTQTKDVKNIISEEFNKAGLQYRTDSIGEKHPESLMDTVFICLVVNAIDKGELSSVMFHFELRQYSFLVKDLAKGITNPIKLPTATNTFNNIIEKKNMAVIFEKIRISARNFAGELLKLKTAPIKPNALGQP